MKHSVGRGAFDEFPVLPGCAACVRQTDPPAQGSPLVPVCGPLISQRVKAASCENKVIAKGSGARFTLDRCLQSAAWELVWREAFVCLSLALWDVVLCRSALFPCPAAL